MADNAWLQVQVATTAKNLGGSGKQSGLRPGQWSLVASAHLRLGRPSSAQNFGKSSFAQAVLFCGSPMQTR